MAYLKLIKRVFSILSINLIQFYNVIIKKIDKNAITSRDIQVATSRRTKCKFAKKSQKFDFLNKKLNRHSNSFKQLREKSKVAFC